MTKVVELMHVIRAFCWVPLTAFVFVMGWENIVAITLLYSAYANFESGLATYQGRRSERVAHNKPDPA